MLQLNDIIGSSGDLRFIERQPTAATALSRQFFAAAVAAAIL